MTKVLIVPGLRNSGPAHWQSWFEALLPETRRVEQADWERPRLDAWAARVGAAIDACAKPPWLVAHSFGCLATASAGLTRGTRIRGALLVAPADPARFGEPVAPLARKLPFPSLVVASANDPWMKSGVAAQWAEHWGSSFVNIGAAGHINVDSGHGPWPQGLQFFEQLRTGRLPAADTA
ncbi:alpha/beta hydrolase [Dechloromonas sp. H13]|uniref:RBBP9/YdeN family alpha/beta hydrolase n=1 Tax=Dechloromonas sp. H13 TaxID=2570193 RepID=UPI001291B613|nr:alpha/beta hydrolase [Dechloromonas sp. H13]